MSNATKSGIVWLRRVQLGLRSLELIGALGLLALMILIANVDALTAWVMRIAVSLRDPYLAFHYLTACTEPNYVNL